MGNIVKVLLTSARLKKNKYFLKGKILNINLLNKEVNLLVRNRTTLDEKTFPCTLEMTRKRQCYFECHLDNISLFSDAKCNQEQVIDIFLLDLKNQKKYKIGNPFFWVRHTIRDHHFKSNDNIVTVCPYFTFKKNNLSFKVNAMKTREFQYMRWLLAFSWLLRFLFKPQNIWLVGELDYKAQDNGMHFYNYMRRAHPEKKVYYVVDKSSKERMNLLDKSNVLNFYSKKHLLFTIVARRIITTHHPDYIYPTQLKRYKKRVKGIKVFITHGVFGVKNMYKNYGNFVNGFHVDHITANSDYEKNIMIRDLKYRKEQISVTGMPRLDQLFNNNIECTQGLLIMPTWRDWLLNEEAFINSEFYTRFSTLINNDKINALMKSYNMKITLSLHPNFRRYTHYFANEYVNLVFQGDESVQKLIKTHSIMITDYSSVAFDFSFLRKPVIFYVFDIERFVGNHTSHLNIPEDLPGACVKDLDELIYALEHYLKGDWPKKSSGKINKLIKYNDQCSSERVYQACVAAKKSRNRITESLIIKVIKVFKNKLKRMMV
ncbi:hypothetical protein HMI01_22540 [Halolactibacillus miurensis]|uniref:CDP-glycerol glycerophosphotransferase, TagB/SpsB family n=1 Tax=Halolactibacillus miurensis TaxID=306541 RepID=A0A1I6UJ80_9BACI|nr:CDP-glycerol glycerophosphotransferase family protein [Halolactibacillus miurensis]GEM05266.1 hypothetical protein HMI01_22540 [Halolactibacillus miurensis]SFT01519.1 CDP-glycerol glycerophosphotransferase, TagB/SpsB family [Halolactibacillus miurensis]